MEVTHEAIIHAATADNGGVPMDSIKWCSVLTKNSLDDLRRKGQIPNLVRFRIYFVEDRASASTDQTAVGMQEKTVKVGLLPTPLRGPGSVMVSSLGTHPIDA